MPETEMTIHPNFAIRCEVSGRRVKFQFSGNGSNQSGVFYVARSLSVNPDVLAEARRAAKIACKRAGATTVQLWAVV
jgi:hypothetical protein